VPVGEGGRRHDEQRGVAVRDDLEEDVWVTGNVSTVAAAGPGPGLIAVAQPATVCAPAPLVTPWFGWKLKLGASLTG
jgi:hypothetical protein